MTRAARANLKPAGMLRAPPLTHPRASVRYCSHHHLIAWHGNVQIILSNEPPTLQAMTEMIRQLERLDETCRGGTGCLLVIRAEVAPPSEEGRRYIRTALGQSKMLAAAQVVLGTGFRGAAMRSVLSVLQLLMRPRFPMRIFGDTATAADWLTFSLVASGATSTLSAESLSRSVRELSVGAFSAPG
jgi:hypothetical protein